MTAIMIFFFLIALLGVGSVFLAVFLIRAVFRSIARLFRWAKRKLR